MAYYSDPTAPPPPAPPQAASTPVYFDPFVGSIAEQGQPPPSTVPPTYTARPDAPIPAFQRPPPGQVFAGPMQANPASPVFDPNIPHPTLTQDLAAQARGHQPAIYSQGTSIGAYDPTLREQITQSLYGDKPRSPEAEATIRGIFGTTGVGQVGPSVADFTPAGSIFGLQEAYRAGNPQALALAAIGMIPGVGAESSALRGATESEYLPSFLRRTGEGWRANDMPPPMGHNLPPPPPEPEIPGVGDRISTRVPYAKNLGFDPHANNDLQVGLESAKMSPDAFKKNADLIRSYDGTGIAPNLSDEETVNAYIGHLKSNILYIHDAMDPGVRDVSKDWYKGANGIATGWAKDYNLTPSQTSAVIAAQSPQKDWYQNVSLAQRVLDINKNEQNTVIDDAMNKWGQEYARKNAGSDGAADMNTFLGRNQGVAFKDIQDPLDRAYFIRTFDEAHNDRSYSIYSPRGDKVGPVMNQDGVTKSDVGWGSMPTIMKADAVLRDGSRENISRQMGGAHKVRSFYNNIVSPDALNGDVTIDTHAIAGSNFWPLTGGDEMTAQGLGQKGAKSASTGQKGLYGIQAEAWRQAAAERGYKPRELQSIVWEGTRSMFDANRKADTGYRDAISGPWRDFHLGLLSQEEAQRRALAAATDGRGIGKPDWAVSNPQANAGAGAPANAQSISGSGLRGTPASAAGGGGGGAAAGTVPVPMNSDPYAQ